MSYLVVPKQGQAQAAQQPLAQRQGWPWNHASAAAPMSTPAADAALEKRARDMLLAEASASASAGVFGGKSMAGLRAARNFESRLAAEQEMARRPVHNDRFLGNTLKQIASHNRRELDSMPIAPNRPGGGGGGGVMAAAERVGGVASRGDARRGGSSSGSSRSGKVKVVFAV